MKSDTLKNVVRNFMALQFSAVLLCPANVPFMEGGGRSSTFLNLIFNSHFSFPTFGLGTGAAASFSSFFCL